MLSDNRQYRESANFINRLSGSTFGVIVHDLPVDLFIESMPQSLPIIESLYTKVFLSDGSVTRNSIQFLRPESVVMQMVKYFAQQDGIHPPPPSSASTSAPGSNFWRWDYCGPFMSSCKKLLRVIVLSDPKIRKGLHQKRRALDKAIEGLGQHGLVGTSDENLMNLHDALQVEFRRVVQSYKIALSKLEELDLAHKKTTVGRTVSTGPAPISASHQRLLSLKQSDIQERLIKNKTLLNVVEPTLTNHSLDLFLGILQRRIELDKDVLFQFSQLRRDQQPPGSSASTSGAKPSESSSSASVVIAPILMKYSHGCQQVRTLSDYLRNTKNWVNVVGYIISSPPLIRMKTSWYCCDFLTSTVVVFQLQNQKGMKKKKRVFFSSHFDTLWDGAARICLNLSKRKKQLSSIVHAPMQGVSPCNSNYYSQKKKKRFASVERLISNDETKKNGHKKQFFVSMLRSLDRSLLCQVDCHVSVIDVIRGNRVGA